MANKTSKKRQTRKQTRKQTLRKRRMQRGGAMWTITGGTGTYNIWTNDDFPGVHISQTKANLGDYHSTWGHCHYKPGWHPGAVDPTQAGFDGGADNCTEPVRLALVTAYHNFKAQEFPAPKPLAFGKPWGANYGEY